VKRPGTIVGVLALAAIAYISYNSIATEGPGSRGIEAGNELPAFAVPLALSDLEGDADMSCDERGEDILNVCELADRGPVVLAFFAEPIARCVEQIDILDRLRPRFPDVQFAAVATLGDRDDLRERIRERGWGLPVGHDQDGAVANAYAVAVCPQITFARRGGEVTRTTFGSQDEAELTAAIEEL
jgi:AhpC/TSA family